jgi:hypothetical protein
MTTTTRYADETRIATHRGRVVGYYARAMPPTTGARAWRGVTIGGTLVYAATPRDIVQALREAVTS